MVALFRVGGYRVRTAVDRGENVGGRGVFASIACKPPSSLKFTLLKVTSIEVLHIRASVSRLYFSK